jgi:hypothetical protein
LSLDEFDALPSTITVREIYYYIFIPGFRTGRVSLITTLLDTTTYSPLEVIRLYGKRWDVEINQSQCHYKLVVFYVDAA